MNLKFKDENGQEMSVSVDRDEFTIGRHSSCDLTYTDSRLSREHLRIDKEDGEFVVSDPGSSNGTTINGTKITLPVALKDGDVLDLGGGLEIKIEFEAENNEASKPSSDAAQAADPTSASEIPAPVSSVQPSVPVAQPEPAGGIPTAFFFIAPMLAVFVLAIVVGAVVLFGGGDKTVVNTGDDIGQTSGNDDEDTENPPDDDSTPSPIKTSTPPPSNVPNGVPTSSPGSSGTELPPSGTNQGETAKIEHNSAVFLRQIAQNDPRAFLTGEQAAKVNTKIKQVGRSSALSDNISSARKNASAIKALASSKNLKPQFLAVAAITKLGGTRGDVLQSAQSIADVYDQLGIQIGNENFDDALLMVAAYDQGAAGESMKMRNMLQDLATKSSEGTRTIRSIWFLEKAGKITSGEYDRALTFLAIGTIAQNPKDFGVNAEALKL